MFTCAQKTFYINMRISKRADTGHIVRIGSSFVD